jgi:predicted deacylase
VKILELRGEADGPTLALLGGVHGDELEGIAAVRAVVARLKTQPFSGRVLAVAVANPSAHAAGSRTNPIDDGNLARCFPGDPSGSETERIADSLTHKVIRRADLLIDLHSAGAKYAMPFFAGFCDPAGADAAHAFGAPLIWAHDKLNPGRSLTTAAAFGVAAVYVEGSGGFALRRHELHGYRDGVLRVMHLLGMHPEVPGVPVPQRILRGGDGDVDSSVSAGIGGWCVTAVRAGDQVRRGDLVAEIIGVEGTPLEQIRAPHDGTVMMLRRRAPVEPGDGIVMLGPVPQEIS